jgi:hypothetical protein
MLTRPFELGLPATKPIDDEQRSDDGRGEFWWDVGKAWTGLAARRWRWRRLWKIGGAVGGWETESATG